MKLDKEKEEAQEFLEAIRTGFSSTTATRAAAAAAYNNKGDYNDYNDDDNDEDYYYDIYNDDDGGGAAGNDYVINSSRGTTNNNAAGGNNNNNNNSGKSNINSTSNNNKGNNNKLKSNHKMSHVVSNTYQKLRKNEEQGATPRHTGRDDRATLEQCLDPRTRLLLFGMLRSGFIKNMDGCLSTGKEANVYYANAGDDVVVAEDATAGGAGGDKKKNRDHQDQGGNKNGEEKFNEKEKGGSSGGFGTLNMTKININSDSYNTNSSNNNNINKDELTTTKNNNNNDPNKLLQSQNKVTEYAIKIFKTSILVFKDRDKYVSGEHRWRHGYCKSNPRKMVKVWAEKEMRNLRRLHAACIPCPEPILLRNHVLVMSFLGTGGSHKVVDDNNNNSSGGSWPSPRLKDAAPNLSQRNIRKAYVQSCLILRRMYRRCRLVHGDYSEYNLLWHDKNVYVIDVSQSVEMDHPSAYDFLRRDCLNVTSFFEGRVDERVGTTNNSNTSSNNDNGADEMIPTNGGLMVHVMSTVALFNYVIAKEENNNQNISTLNKEEDSTGNKNNNDINNNDNAMEDLQHAMTNARKQFVKLSNLTPEDRQKEEDAEKVDRAVFMSRFIPRSLVEVDDHEEKDCTAGAAMIVMNNTSATTSSSTTTTLRGNDDECDDNEDNGRDDEENDNDECRNDDKELENGDVNDTDDDEEGDSEYDSEGYYIKGPPMTPEEILAAKEAKRDSMRINKKAVKVANSLRRQTKKIRKKDKRKAIKKTKGNKKK